MMGEPQESSDPLDAHIQGLRDEFKSNRQRVRNEQLRSTLRIALVDCGNFARRLVPERGSLHIECEHWPKNQRTRQECRGYERSSDPRWPKWNLVLCKRWILSWMNIAHLLRELELAGFVQRLTPPPDPIHAPMHELFVRLLPHDLGKPEVHLIAKDIALHRARVANAARELEQVRYRLGYYFDQWLWPLVEAQLKLQCGSDSRLPQPATDNAPVSDQGAASEHADPDGSKNPLWPHNLDPEGRNSLSPDPWLSATDIARARGIKYETFRKHLERWRRNADSGWREATDRKPREPKYLYQMKAVDHLIQKSIASGQPSSERPANRNSTA